MILFPAGLYTGERLTLCSDEARLHFPYIAGLANSLGRLQLSVPQILGRAYQNFKSKPSKHQLADWIAEYRRNHLLFIYKSPAGEVWGQLCGIPDNALPRYQTATDKRSPAPIPEDLAAFDAEYVKTKRERAEASENFLNFSEHFENLPKSSGPSGTFLDISAGEDEDVDVVEDVDEEVILSSQIPPESADLASDKPRDEEARDVVRHVFAYFLEQTGRSERQYELTDTRMQAGLRAFRVCLKRCRDPERAQLAMAAAVDGLIANDWNMGRDPKSKKRFTEWTDHVFKNVETMEKRWQDGGFNPDV